MAYFIKSSCRINFKLHLYIFSSLLRSQSRRLRKATGACKNKRTQNEGDSRIYNDTVNKSTASGCQRAPAKTLKVSHAETDVAKDDGGDHNASTFYFERQTS